MGSAKAGTKARVEEDEEEALQLPQITALAKNEWRPAALHGIGQYIGAFASQPPFTNGAIR
jgi:hypothetical protein